MSIEPAGSASIQEVGKQQTNPFKKADLVNPQATKPKVAKPVFKKKAKSGPKPAAERPNKYLPTPRITFSKQLDILRAWAAASGPTGKVATNDGVAEIVKMQPSTVSLANPFLASSGLLVKTDGGYIPCPEVMSF